MTSGAACPSRQVTPSPHLASYVKCTYLYVPGGTGTLVRINTLAKLQKRRNHVVRHSDAKARIMLVTSTCTKSCNVNLHECTRHIKASVVVDGVRRIKPTSS
jgi:hypothetical protein